MTRHEIAQLVESLKGKKRPDTLLLQPLIEVCQRPEVRGIKRTIAKRMSKMSGRSVTRDMVRLWLHPEQSKRREPSLNYGLLLIAAVIAVVANPKPTKASNDKHHQK